MGHLCYKWFKSTNREDEAAQTEPGGEVTADDHSESTGHRMKKKKGYLL